MQENAYIYVLGDGDKIREHVEHYLLNGEVELLAGFSQGLVNAINEIKLMAEVNLKAKIIIAAGDDIFFRMDKENYRTESILQIGEVFYKISGCTISFGIGNNIEEVYINLRRAKASKTTRIVEGVIDS